MVDKRASSRSSTNSRRTSASSNQLDSVYRDGIEGRYADDRLEFRPPSGTNYQQPGSHLSIDTRLSELNLEKLTLVTEGASCILSGSGSRVASSTSHKKNGYANKVLADKPNCYVTAPFKQGPHKTKKTPFQTVDPGHDLKEATRERIEKVQLQFRQPKPPRGQVSSYHRLRKARLKTTGRPISGSGPSINQCKGILAGQRAVPRVHRPKVYFREDLSRIASPSPRPRSPSELLRPESSVHCTSRASSETYTEECESDVTDSIHNGATGRWVERGHCPVENSLSDWSSVDHDNFEDKPFDVDYQSYQQNGQSKETSNMPSGSPTVISEEDKTSVSGFSKDEVLLSKSTEKQYQTDSLIQRLRSTDQEQSTSESQYEPNERKSALDNINLQGCKPCVDGNKYDVNDDDDDDDVKHYHGNVTSSYGNALGSLNETKDKTSKTESTKYGSEGGTNRNSHTGGKNTQQCSEGNFDGDSGSLGALRNGQNSRKSRRNENSWVGLSESHVVGSCSSEDGLLMSIHVRKRITGPTVMGNQTRKTQSLEATNGSRPTSTINNPRPTSGEKFDHEEDVDFVDTESVDSDLIPTEEIWRNLDTLNLSMSTLDKGVEKHEKFGGKARKVQSAGSRRKELNTPPLKEKITCPASAKQRTNCSSEKPDKAEVLRKYFSQEGERFTENLRANLPGYFTEQYNIIQEQDKCLIDQTGSLNEVENTLDKGLVESNGQQDESDDHYVDTNGPVFGQTWPFSSMEPFGDSSMGVFVTSEVKENSTSGDVTCTSGIDTISQMTEETYEDCGYHGDSDAGFEETSSLGFAAKKQPNEEKRIMSKNFDCRQSQITGSDDDLEVVAKAKQLSEARPNQKYLPAPFPPLNFTINAVPPPGHMYYFAYGADMNINRMSIYLRREHKRLWGVLFGFKLRFNKKGSSQDAGGFPNVEYSPGFSVEGCVYTITDAELGMLDNCMGYHKHYTRVVVPVWMANSYHPSQLGVAQYCVPAVLYVAEQDWIETESPDKLDCSYSLGQCLKAGDLLTPNYLQYLQQLGAGTR